ncbi:MAG: META domain-containing protein [Deinococcus sp.]|nr:META domain-containing protein [Deinococcus sp.]
MNQLRTRTRGLPGGRLLGWTLLGAALLGQGVAGAQSAPASLAGQWTVVGPGGVLNTSSARPTLTLDGRAALSGDAGCNRLIGRYAARGTVLLTAGVAVTRRACDPATMRVEEEVLGRLNRVTRFALDGELLTLQGARGDLVLRRTGPALNLNTSLVPTPPQTPLPLETPMPQPAQTPADPAIAGAWQVRSLTVGGRPLSLRPGAAFDLSVAGGAAGLELSGTLGCNRLRATGQVESRDEWLFTGVTSTRMACDPELMTAETGLTALLRGALRAEHSGDRLTLRSAGGELVLERAAPQAAAEWAPSYQGTQLRLDGQDVALTAPVTFSFEPQADGSLRLSATAGCNGLFGAGQPEENGWTFAGLGGTVMACADMSAEDRVRALLGGGFKLFREGKTLALRSDRGELQLTPTAAADPEPAEATRPSGGYTLAELRRDGQALDLNAFHRPVTLNFTQGAQGQPTLGGSDGCNTFGGAYEWVDGGLRLPQPPLSTMMFCPGLETLPRLSAALTATPDLTLSGDTLTLRHQGVEWVFRRG